MLLATISYVNRDRGWGIADVSRRTDQDGDEKVFLLLCHARCFLLVGARIESRPLKRGTPMPEEGTEICFEGVAPAGNGGKHPQALGWMPLKHKEKMELARVKAERTLRRKTEEQQRTKAIRETEVAARTPSPKKKGGKPSKKERRKTAVS